MADRAFRARNTAGMAHCSAIAEVLCPGMAYLADAVYGRGVVHEGICARVTEEAYEPVVDILLHELAVHDGEGIAGQAVDRIDAVIGLRALGVDEQGIRGVRNDPVAVPLVLDVRKDNHVLPLILHPVGARLCDRRRRNTGIRIGGA